MRTFIQAMLAMVVVVAAVAIAPRGAEAQECVQRHFDWVATPTGNPYIIRSEKIQVVEVHDTLKWTGHASMTLNYTPSRFTGTFFFPARMSGEGTMSFSDRTRCADTGGGLCTIYQNFDIQNMDAIRVTFTRNLIAANPLAFRFDALRWGGSQSPTNGVCLNNNTVAYSMPGDVTYIVNFTDEQRDTTPPH